jgi:acyl CoA:acetate/3-ketoacid CoA transferase beta subunit
VGARLLARDSIPPELRQRLDAELGSTAQALSVVGAITVRVVSQLGVFDVTSDAWRLREVPPGVSAAEVQARISTPLLCGPDLAEVFVETT